METVCVYVTAISCFPWVAMEKIMQAFTSEIGSKRGDTLYAGMLGVLSRYSGRFFK